ncbi:MAG: hypothetical protein IKQ37_05560 [Bacteroidaceae bacterium]|nr:hypothetical protein [Bacteroidaceae bacterium]
MERKIDVGAALSNAAGKLEKALEMIRDTSKFVSEQGVSEVLVEETKLKDGIYLAYDDGTSSPFTGEESKDGVHGIGVVYDGHAFQVALEDLGEWGLVKDLDKCPEESPFYKTECEGLHDWDFMSATEHIKAIGTDIPLPDGWYIPTLAVLEVMCFWKEAINKALVYAGGKPMPDDFHWSSTEYGRHGARLVHFSNGNANYYNKYITFVIRPVTAF